MCNFGKSALVDRLPEQVAAKIDWSVQFLTEELAKCRSVYGMAYIEFEMSEANVSRDGHWLWRQR